MRPLTTIWDPTTHRRGHDRGAGRQRINYNLQNLLTYDQSFGGHQLSALLGQEYLQEDFYFTETERRGYNNDVVPYLRAAETVQANDQATERL